MTGKSLQHGHEPPFQAPITLIWMSGRKNNQTASNCANTVAIWKKLKKNSTILVVTKHRHTMCAYTFKFDCCLVETAELMANNFVTFSIKLNPRTQKKGKIICQIIPDHLPRKEERQKAEGGNGSQRGEKQFKGMHLTSLEFLEGWWRDFKIF